MLLSNQTCVRVEHTDNNRVGRLLNSFGCSTFSPLAVRYVASCMSEYNRRRKHSVRQWWIQRVRTDAPNFSAVMGLSGIA